MNGRHTGTSDRPTYPEVKATHGEDPARYLAVDENDAEDDHPLALAHARIRGIDDVALLKQWQRIEAEHWGRREVMQHLDKRERELAGESISAEPTSEETTDEDREPSVRSPIPETTPATATDGGTELSYDEIPDETADTVGSDAEPDDVHSDVRRLEAGQVLVLERADGTEYIFPAQPDADEPFLCRSFDSEGDERTADPIPLTLGEVASRPIDDTDPVSVSEVDVRAPKLAATKGGDS